MDWQNQIPACFGCVDQIFAEHPLDEERAIKMLKAAFLSGASESDVFAALCDYMKTKNCPPSHIDDQINKTKEVILSNNIKA